MTDKDLIAGMWAIVVKHHKANTTPNQMVELLTFVRNHDNVELRERVARLVGAIEDAPHDYKCETLLDWHRQAGSYRMMDDSKCNCWKRTALEGK